MKLATYIILLSIIVSCIKDTSQSNNPSATEDINNFDWLLGDWYRVNDEVDSDTFESWKSIEKDIYSGFAYTIQNQDTVWQERMVLKLNEGSGHLEIFDDEEDTSVIFKLTNSTKTSLVVENPTNPFPNKITYKRLGNNLEAYVYGQDMEIPFEFEPLKKE